MDNKKDLSVLIVSYNCRDYLEKAVKSVFKYSDPGKVEVIVIDNNSSDGSAKAVKDRFPEVLVIQNHFNYGFSVAMNQGFREAKGRYVMSFNPDAEFLPNTYSNVVKFMDDHPHVGKGGLQAIDTDGKVAYPVTEFVRWISLQSFKTIRAKYLRKDVEPPKDLSDVNWLFGTGIVIRKEIFDPDILYPENSFLFWEEYWLSLLIKAKGYHIAIIPEAKIVHHGSVTFKFDPEKVYYVTALSFITGWKVRKEEYGFINAFFNHILYICDNLFLIFMLRLKGLSKKDAARELAVTTYKSRMKISWILLTRGKQTINNLEKTIIRYLNKGVDPKYPVQSRVLS